MKSQRGPMRLPAVHLLDAADSQTVPAAVAAPAQFPVSPCQNDLQTPASLCTE